MQLPYKVRDTGATHVIIEMFGGDNNLSKYVDEDLAEIMAGNAGPIAALALVDRRGAGGSQVIELSPRTGRHVVEELGEIDTGDPPTLARFLSRALVSYPAAKRRVVGFWDHGTGVFDEHDASEVVLGRRPVRTPRGAARKLFIPRSYATNERMRAMLHDDTSGGVLTNREAGGVLAAGFAEAGMQGQKIDMIFSDTCLNGMIEVVTELAPYAHVIAGSEELEPGDGWDYRLWLDLLSRTPPDGPEAWGSTAVEAFGRSYRDRTGEHPVTMAAFRTGVDLAGPFKRLVETLDPLGDEGFDWLDKARRNAQSFARMNTYDLRDLAVRLASTAKSAEVVTACRHLVAAHDTACIQSVAWGDDVPEAHGLALWFPTDRHTFRAVEPTYKELAFAGRTGWSAYLRKQYL